MPEEGVPLTPPAHLLTTDEIVRLGAFFVGLGVDKIRLTGGEPLLRGDVEAVAEGLGRLPGLRALALTTNGLLLARKLPRLQAAGLRQINISLDTLRPERFRAITRRDGLELVRRAIAAALAAGYAPLKVNCVVMRGVNDDEVTDFVALTREAPIEVRFIEFMPFDGNGWDDAAMVPYAEMRARLEAAFPSLQPCEDGPHETARTFQVPGYRGRVGLIASMSAPFCAGCNRLRLTADGHLKVCLFGPGEVSLRDALRAGASEAELRGLVAAAVQRKQAAHVGKHMLAATANRPMILIGG